MDATLSPPNTVNARVLLLPYVLTLMVAMGIIHAVINFTGGHITLLTGVFTAVVALGIATWLLVNYRALTRVRFGVAIAHAIAFVTVTTSFNVHAVLRAAALGSGPEGFEIVSHHLLATPWFGATLVMSAFWGVGLLIHLVGAVFGRGWED